MSNLSKGSKVWVYQSDRQFTSEETKVLQKKLDQFVLEWVSHQNKLLADYQILYNRFIILIVDEKQAGASGCSIDSSVHFIQSLEKSLNLSLFNRLLVHYFDNEELISVSLSEFQALIENGKVNQETKVIDTLIQNLDELENDIVKPAQSTWLKRYFKVQLIE